MLAFVMWSLVLGIVLMSYTINIWLGVAFTGLVVLTHWIVALVARKRGEGIEAKGEGREARVKSRETRVERRKKN